MPTQTGISSFGMGRVGVGPRVASRTRPRARCRSSASLRVEPGPATERRGYFVAGRDDDLQPKQLQRVHGLADLSGLLAPFEFGQEPHAYIGKPGEPLQCPSLSFPVRPHQPAQLSGRPNGSVVRCLALQCIRHFLSCGKITGQEADNEDSSLAHGEINLAQLVLVARGNRTGYSRSPSRASLTSNSRHFLGSLCVCLYESFCEEPEGGTGPDRPIAADSVLSRPIRWM